MTPQHASINRTITDALNSCNGTSSLRFSPLTKIKYPFLYEEEGYVLSGSLKDCGNTQVLKGQKPFDMRIFSWLRIQRGALTTGPLQISSGSPYPSNLRLPNWSVKLLLMKRCWRVFQPPKRCHGASRGTEDGTDRDIRAAKLLYHLPC